MGNLKVGEVTVFNGSWCGCANPANDCAPDKQSGNGLGSVVCKRALGGAPQNALPSDDTAEHRLADTAPDTSDFRTGSKPQHLNELPNLVRFNGRP